MKRKLLIAATALVLIATGNNVYAQHGGQRPDPKTMTAKMAEKLEFTQEQQTQLATLNEKYTGNDFDKRQYREEFRQIMTDEQRAKADDMRKKHEGSGMKGKGRRGDK